MVINAVALGLIVLSIPATLHAQATQSQQPLQQSPQPQHSQQQQQRQQYEFKDNQWKPVVRHDPDSPEGMLQTIARVREEGEAEQSEELATAWIEQFPNHPRLVDAYMLRGDARVARRRYYRALYDYEFVIRSYPGTEQFNLAMEREFEIARLFGNGVKRHFLGMRILPAYEEAEEILIRIQERAPGSDLGEKASLELGDFYFRRAQMTQAAEAYDLFLQNYPRSPHRERVLLRIIQSNLATFKGPRFDSTGLIEAQQRIRQYDKDYPVAAEKIGTPALNVRIDESLALKVYHTARWYERTGERVSAIYNYRRVIKDHPRTAAAQLALDRLEDMEASPVPAAPGTAPGSNPGSTPGSTPGSSTRPAATLPYEQLSTQPSTRPAPAPAPEKQP